MRRSLRFWFAFVSLILLVALILWWKGAKRQTAGPAPADVAAIAATSQATNAATTPAIERLDASNAARRLPPPGTISELASRAGAGDAVAACQLAAELTQCRTDETLRRHLRDSESVAAPRCSQLLDRHLDRHFDWLRQAAHAGEPEAMLRYARGEGFGISGESFSYLRSPHFETWRREAPAMLQSLLEAGYPEAAIYRMMANDALMGGPMANLVQPDPVQDQAYNELFLLLNDDADISALLRARSRSQAGSLVVEQARQQAERWHQENFGGQTFNFSSPDAESESGFPLMRAHGKNCSTDVNGASS